MSSARRGACAPCPTRWRICEPGGCACCTTQSFSDDPTRLLRLARYAARLGFEVEEHTAELAAAAVATRALDTVSGARIGAELRLALAEADALRRACRDGRAGAARPRCIRGCASSGRVARARARAAARRRTAPDLLMMLPALASRWRCPGCAPDLRRLGDPARGDRRAAGPLEFPAADRDRVAAAAAAVPRLIERAAAPPSALAAARRRRRRAARGGRAGGGVSETVAEPARRWLTELRHVRLEITGDDLLAAGVPEGPEIGRRLDVSLASQARWRASADEREAELAAALGGGRHERRRARIRAARRRPRAVHDPRARQPVHASAVTITEHGRQARERLRAQLGLRRLCAGTRSTARPSLRMSRRR